MTLTHSKYDKIQAGNATAEVITECLPFITTVLELGGGSGKLTKLILENSKATVDVYEHKQKYQDIMREELKGYESRYTLIPDYKILPPKRDYDLVIVDGGGRGTIDECDFPQGIWFYLKSLDSVRYIIIEGQRRRQKHWILDAIKDKYVYEVETFEDPTGGKKISTLLTLKPCANWFVRKVNQLRNNRKVVKKFV